MLSTNSEWRYELETVFQNILRITHQFEACSASIAARATYLIGIYVSDNGQKGE